MYNIYIVYIYIDFLWSVLPIYIINSIIMYYFHNTIDLFIIMFTAIFSSIIAMILYIYSHIHRYYSIKNKGYSDNNSDNFIV